MRWKFQSTACTRCGIARSRKVWTMTSENLADSAHCRPNSGSKSLGSSSLRFGRFHFSIPRRRAGFQRVKKSRRDSRYLIHSGEEPNFVGPRRLMDSTDFSDELERRCPNLFRGDGRLKVEKSFDVSAHGIRLACETQTVIRDRERLPVIVQRRAARP